MKVSEIVNTIYAAWGKSISKTAVKDNYSMENSTVVAQIPAATLYFTGLPTTDSDLEGNEASVTPTVQVDIYTKGQRALSQAYEIDEVSHGVLNGVYGFRRSYGPELIQSTDPSIKRLTSRYTRLVGLEDKITE